MIVQLKRKHLTGKTYKAVKRAKVGQVTPSKAKRRMPRNPAKHKKGGAAGTKGFKPEMEISRVAKFP